MQRLSRIKMRKKSQRVGNQMEIKSQGGFQGICSSELKVRHQPAPRACGERGRRGTHSVLTLPCRIYFPLAVARQHHLDRERRRMARRGIKTERGLTLTRNAQPHTPPHTAPLRPCLTAGVIFHSSCWERGQRTTRRILGPWQRSFSSFNLRGIMAFTHI